MTLVLAIAAGGLIGLTLGALGGGGSILAVPVLVFLLGQDASQATTGSLVVVGLTATLGAATAYRAGNVLLARGAAFGLVATGGAAVGARASAHVSDAILLTSFAVLMLLIGGLMAVRQVRASRPVLAHAGAGGPARAQADRLAFDDPVITLRPGFLCDCPRALKIVVTATLVGLLTGFLGVGGGFLVVPALVLALSVPLEYAAGTALVVISLTSAAALVVRLGVGHSPDWPLVALLTVAATVGGVAGARVADRTDTARLSAAFTVLVLGVGSYTAFQGVPALA